MKNSYREFYDKESQKDYFKDLLDKINYSSKTSKILPKKELWFNALNYCDVNELKLIVFGQDPYYLDNVADGLAFSSQEAKTPKSLLNLFKELKNDYPNTVIETNDLTSWAKNGILLLNRTLTVNENQPNSHRDFGWEIFNKNLIEFIWHKNNKVVFALLGKDAQIFFNEVNQKLNAPSNQIIIRSHPSPLSYSRTKEHLKDSGFFKEINSKVYSPIDFNLRKD